MIVPAMVVLYVVVMAAANVLIAVGGPGWLPVTAFAFLGFQMVARDKLHDRWHGPSLWPRMGAMIAAAGFVAWAVQPAAGRVAVASMCALVVAAIVDTLIYQAAFRFPWLVRSNTSNVGEAVADSLVFPTIAFGAFVPWLVLTQAAIKIAGGFVWSLVIRYTLDPDETRAEPVTATS